MPGGRPWLGRGRRPLVGLVLFFRRKYRAEFNSLRGWRPERELFGRLMKYGGPAGVQVFLDVLVFHFFMQLVGRLGEAAAAATTLTVRLNMVAFLPMIGLGQAVSILVGQRLGADRPDLAERSAYTGLKWVFGYMCIVAAVYLLFPRCARGCVPRERRPRRLRRRGRHRPEPAGVRGRVLCGRLDQPDILVCSARRWRHPVRVAAHLRTGLADHGGADIPGRPCRSQSIYWAWGFASAYIIAMAVCFYLAVPVRAVEEHARDRGCPAGGHGAAGESIAMKSTVEEIRQRFDADVERFSNLETGQSATVDAPLAMALVAKAAAHCTPHARHVLDIGCGAGNYTLKLLELLPNLDATLIDLSRPMLERAAERVGKARRARSP